ncbi:hypothetical protein PSN45_001710 [Yamadazyma tenuis]|uniref:uncharacterized protein n=1 Tax=Candida tenuis TaxID=2315449 RepID=UPI0027A1F2D0|nr:hypothetical protein PSN45_001710 [Yamadazyma tenuis]
MKFWTPLLLAVPALCDDVSLFEWISNYEIALESCQAQIDLTATVCLIPETAAKRGLVRRDDDFDPTSCYCTMEAPFVTLIDCFVKGEGNKTSYMNSFIDSCKGLTDEPLTLDSLYSTYYSGLKHMKNVSTVENFSLTEVVDYPVLLGYKQYKINRQWEWMAEKNKNLGSIFGLSLMGYWGLVLLLATLVNWTIYLFPGFTGLFVGPLSNMWRKYVSLPAAISRRKTRAVRFGLLVPSRMESLIIFVFLFLTAMFSGINIHSVPGNEFSQGNYVARFVAIRTGIMVGYICPLLVLFAGRNNFLQWLTRWNFATFITYHRWVSRIVVLLVIIHAIGFTVSDISRDKYSARVKEGFIQWGIVACVCGGIILVQGLLVVRRKSYEAFLVIHILMAMFFVIGGYKHTLGFGYQPLYWTSIAVWAIDRLIRFTRLFVFGAPMATVTLLAEETLRVVIPKPSFWHATPGGHAFVHFIRPSCFWQSHPFTFTDSSEEGNYIVMYIKLKGGVTHGVYKHLANAPGKSAKIRVLVEGPYGEDSSARKYKNAVFIAGGNGIPGIYSECIDIARKTVDGNGPRLKLIWIIREWKSLAWFYQELRNLNNTNIDTTVFVTKPLLNLENGLTHLKPILIDSESSYSDKEKTNSDVKDSSLPCNDSDSEETSMVASIKNELSHISFQEGRPEIHDLICNEISQADGSLAFVTCGHPHMVDEVRFEVSQNLHQSKHRIEYFEQLQVWA